MKIGFVSPSFRMLEINWQHDFEMMKLGVPTFMSYLYRAGHQDLMHWDFDAQVCSAVEADPSAFDIKVYFDTDAVKGFLDGTNDALRGPTEWLLATLDVQEREIYGFSLSAVLDRIVNVVAIAAVSQCMAKVLKERYPECRIVFGGLQVNPDALQEEYYSIFMKECPEIDYCFLGRGDEMAVQLFRHISAGEQDKIQSLARVFHRIVDETGAERIQFNPLAGFIPSKSLDPDLVVSPTQFKVHHRAHTKAGATAQAGDAVNRAQELAGVSLAGGNLGRKVESLARNRRTDGDSSTTALTADGSIAYDQTHDEKGLEIPADVAGALEYERIPARVPVFDPKLVDGFRYSGLQIMKRFHFNKEMMLRFSRHENDQIVVLPHIFVRGCNAPCGFCGYAYKAIEGEDLIETVEGLKWLSETYNCKNFHFLNTQINSVYQYAEAFCDAVIAARLDILWSDCCNMRFLDENLLDKLRAAGAMRLVYGIESPEDEMLRYIHKGITVAKIERLLKAAHERGIWNHCLLIAGMPHETPAKQQSMMDFIRNTSEYLDYYTVSSFYLIASSPWGRDPAKFGIDRISSPDELLEDQAFNEKADGRWTSDNLPWAKKKQQIVDSTRLFYRTISSAKGQTRCVGGNIDLYLLMFLYSTLGHDNKAEIRRIYEQTAQFISPSLRSSDHGTGESALEPEMFRIKYPVIVGRVNEGDQSSLVHVPITLSVAPRSAGKPGFCGSPGYTLAYKNPAILSSDPDERFSRKALDELKAELPQVMGRLGQSVGPFLEAIETRYKPASAARMAELLALNLPKFRPFQEVGFTVEQTSRGRTLMERTLQWSGVTN